MKTQEARTLLQRASLSVLLGCGQGDLGCFGVLSGAACAAPHSLLVEAVLEQRLRHCCAAGEAWKVLSAVPPAEELR